MTDEQKALLAQLAAALATATALAQQLAQPSPVPVPPPPPPVEPPAPVPVPPLPPAPEPPPAPVPPPPPPAPPPPVEPPAPPAPEPGPPPPAPAPPPPTVPPAPSSRYRQDQPMLWSDAGLPLPPTVPGGAPYVTDAIGPTVTMVSQWCGWPWRRRGGDWIDADGVLHGAKPWAAHQVGESTVGMSILSRIDITGLVQRAQRDQRWLAMLIQRSGSQTRIAGRYSATPPVLHVVYEDGEQEQIACHVSAAMDGSMSTPVTTTAEIRLPAALEFRRPDRTVSRATLELAVVRLTTGPALLSVMLVDPPRNTEPVQHGIAAAAPLDAALAEHPMVLGLHSMRDDGPDPCYRGRPINLNSRDSWSPECWGGAEDRTKLPHVLGGKLLAGPNFRWLSSTTAGVQPLAPGLGVLRFTKLDQVDVDGEVDGYGRSGAEVFTAHLPPEETGRLREVYVRYYQRIGPLARGRTVRQMVRKQEGGTPYWSDLAGKLGITPTHHTTAGGFSGTAGGGNGWSCRLSWSYRPEITDGPDAGAIPLHLHLYDLAGKNVPGHNYGARTDGSLSQRGAIGVLYPERWYCIEMRLKLNSVDQPAVLANGQPHIIDGVQQLWSPDGEIDYWIDGRLACSMRGMVFRSLPAVGMPSGAKPAYYMPPMRDLGIREVLHDYYHGGTTTMSMDMTVDLTGLVIARQYIGPMRVS